MSTSGAARSKHVPPPNSETIVADARPETLLIFDNATVVLEMGRGVHLAQLRTNVAGLTRKRRVATRRLPRGNPAETFSGPYGTSADVSVLLKRGF
jgi:hypothetical protein